MFQWLFKKRVCVRDVFWRTQKDKIDGIRAVLNSRDKSRSVLLLAHFPATLEKLKAELGIESIIVTQGQLDLRILVGSAVNPPCVVMALTRSLPTQFSAPRDSAIRALDIIVVERYPLRDRDEAVVSCASQVFKQSEIQFNIAMDDALMVAFGGQKIAVLMERLGWKDNSSFEGPMIARSVASAQKTIAKKMIAEHDVRSAEEWFKYNMPKQN